MKEDTIQHLASEMDELQEQHRDVLARVRLSINRTLTPCRYLTATTLCTSTPFVFFSLFLFFSLLKNNLTSNLLA